MEKNYSISEKSLNIGSIALQAVLYESACFPSPGLVSPISSGAHKDMDYYTFLRSASVLSIYLPIFSQIGYSDKESKEIWEALKKEGIKAEGHMLRVTNGVNTHKGTIFIMGLLCACCGKALYLGKGYSYIEEYLIKVSENINTNIGSLNEGLKLSHGEEVNIKYGINGIKTEVKNGLPIVFNYAKGLYADSYELPQGERLIHTLIGIMQYCDDSTILYRGGRDGLHWVKSEASRIMNLGGMKNKEGKEAILVFDREMINKNLSPGGSADLLTATVFLNEIKKMF